LYVELIDSDIVAYAASLHLYITIAYEHLQAVCLNQTLYRKDYRMFSIFDLSLYILHFVYIALLHY